MLNKINNFSTKRVQIHGAQYIPFAVFSILNYPVSFMLLHYFGSQSENLWLRLFAVILSLPLAFANHWPGKIKKYLPLYWHLTLLYSIPFFATFLLLENSLSLEWLMNVSLGLFWFILLVDWLSFIILLSVGASLGFLSFLLFGDSSVSDFFLKDFSLLFLAFYMYFYAIILGLIFSRRRENLQEERQQALKTMGGAIAHEMRTPLATVIMMGTSLRHTAQKIEDFFKKKQTTTTALQEDIESIYHISDDLLDTAKGSQNLITLLLANLKQDFDTLPQKNLSMQDCLNHALEAFVFNSDEKGKVHLHVEEDFCFKGNEELITHVLFNLLKNSLYFIHACGKGEVFITVQVDQHQGLVTFKDTGPGIPKDQLDKLFTPFYSKRPHGTGIGLSFCKKAVESMQGKIAVESQFEEHTTFTICFPKRDDCATVG